MNPSTVSLERRLRAAAVLLAVLAFAASRFGPATATLLAAHGAAVVNAGRNRARGEAAAQALAAAGGRAAFVQTDITREAKVAALVARAVVDFGGLAAYQQPKTGTPRILAIVGIVGGVAGLLNLILTLIGGGNWAQPNNPALSPLIMAAYYIGMILTLAWLL